MTMYVNANFHSNVEKVASGVRYIAHREEGLPEGKTRPLYGIGPRYREPRGDERAVIRLLRLDAAGLERPHFYRLKFTVDDDLSRRVMSLPPREREWAVRDALEHTFRGALRRAQGAFVVHYHGGTRRPFGHPHAHVVLSPRFQDGASVIYLPPSSLARIKERWEREIGASVARHERRQLHRGSLDRLPVDQLGRPRGNRGKTLGERLVELAAHRTITRATGAPTGALLRAGRDARQVGRGIGSGFGRLGLRLAETIAPAPLRTAIRAARLWGRLLAGGHSDGFRE